MLDTMNRVLRAKLPNGQIVELVQPEQHSNATIMQARDRLISLLESDIVPETDITHYLATIFPIVFPSADPSKPPILNPTISQGWRGDIGFAMRNSEKVGVVEIKPPRLKQIDLEAVFDLEQLRSTIAAGNLPTQVAEFHLISGRESIEGISEEVQQAKYPFSVNIMSWDDVVDRLSPTEDKGDEVSRIAFIEVVDSSRRLLARLIKHPGLLKALDDRRLEELVATLLSDLGFVDVELTPARKDGGKDVIATFIDPMSGQREVYLFECKHWQTSSRVSLGVAKSLLKVVKKEKATAGIIVAPGGFRPKLIEQEAAWNKKNIHLRDGDDFADWVTIWERRYGSVVIQSVDVRQIFGMK